MKQKKLSEYTDQELLAEAKKNKSTNTMDALLIGVSIGVVLYSIYAKSFGILTLIPLFFVYKIFKKPNNNAELEKLLKERKLK